eukprot:scaffold10958_cov23-Cyclotella_meneghiniana.AAC.1
MSSARRPGQSPMMAIDYKDYYYCFGSNYPTVRRSAVNSAAVKFHPTFLFVLIIIVCVCLHVKTSLQLAVLYALNRTTNPNLTTK